ncbi:MAG: cyclase [Ruminococcaceae bacterium]|nr:cyclase [Oscillospiraceae bacterium]
MLIDLTMKITPQMAADAQALGKKELEGHLGTHFDVMHEEFPLEYTQRGGIVFDVSAVRDRDIEASDIDIGRVQKNAFVAFYTGYAEKEAYGSRAYFKEHPQLSPSMICALVEKGVSIIGVDCAGIRRGTEHIPTDRYCAEHGVFVVENLCNLKALLHCGKGFTVNTYPMNYTEITGLPCRVIAEMDVQ